MSSARSTRWLAAVLVVAACCCAAAFARLNAYARRADDAGRAFTQSQAQLRQLAVRPLTGESAGGAGGAGGGHGGGHGVAVDAINANSQVNRHLRDAAAVAGVADKLVSIEPGEPSTVAGTDFQEMLIFLRLEPLSLRELVTFLHAHASADSATHTKAIELSTTARNQIGGGELWLADVTLAYISHAPQQSEATPR